MTKNDSKLGRGLAVLLGEMEDLLEGKPTKSSNQPSNNDTTELDIDLLVANPDQPRKDFDQIALQELAISIEQKGVICPIVVRAIEGGKYEIIAGERRYRASIIAGLTRVPVVIKNIADVDAFEIAIIENVQREDLNPIEEAQSYQVLKTKYSYDQNQIADLIGKSRSHVANSLRLLYLPEEVIEMVRNKELSAGHARALVGKEKAEIVAKKIAAMKLSVRQTEELLKKELSDEVTILEKSTRIQDLEAMADLLSKKLNATVKIADRDTKGGTVRISYQDTATLDTILQLLCSKAPQF